MKSPTTLKRSVLQAQYLIICQEKVEGVKMGLFNLLQQNLSVELQMICMWKQFLFELGESGAAS